MGYKFPLDNLNQTPISIMCGICLFYYLQQDILSFSGEKLPWSVHMTNFSVYSLQVPQRAFYVVKPSSLSATLAVTTKYSPPVSDNISSLAFCVHSDMNPISAACNNDQVAHRW